MSANGPLAGVKVIDLTQMLSGPFMTMLLADLGADVIKVEPLSGDVTRYAGPHLSEGFHAYGGYFGSINRNKKSIAVDLKTAAGREVVRRMAQDADLLVENYRAGVPERLGIGWETLHELNPRLVYAAIRGFGDPRTGESPYISWPAFDIVAQAMGGFMSITGPDPEHPLKAGPGIGDLFPASLLAFGALAALRHAERTGEGQFVDVAMYDAVIALTERIIYQYSYTGHDPQPQGNTHPLFCPFDVFETSDGHVTIAAPRDHHWVHLCAVMGRPELGDDPRYVTNLERIQRAAEVRAIVTAWTSRLTNVEVVDALAGKVPSGPVNRASEIMADPHVAMRDMLVTFEHPGTDRTVTFAGNAIKMTGTPPGHRMRAPELDEHRDDVLTSLRFTAEEIKTLRAQGAIN